jgi:acyl-coenzyme A synthetase/AMP-(fatty) acid ligase
MLEEIEFHLGRCAGGREGAVIPWPSGQEAAEFVVAFVAGDLDEQQVKSRMQEYLPRPVVPRRIVALEKLPLNPNGKIDRKALVRLWQQMQAARR